ncbi:MAG: LysR family transcriptional regulator [Holophaga sp.]|nr:LysR family transcriptional regulator [Holophaga sp.]
MATVPSRLASIRIRILCGDEIAMGQGKADLLEAVGESGSISGAGRKLGLSYRKAWLMVDEMNRCFATPVVETAKGGTRGGGARVTEVGKEALAQYRAVQEKARLAVEDDLTRFRHLLAATPR